MIKHLHLSHVSGCKDDETFSQPSNNYNGNPVPDKMVLKAFIKELKLQDLRSVS